MRAAIRLCFSALLGAACVDDKPLEPGQRCPCAPGWTCDQPRQICQPTDAALASDAPEVVAADAAQPPEPDASLGVDAEPDAVVDAPVDLVVACSQVSYPATAFFGPNVLALDATTFVSDSVLGNAGNRRYELAADLVAGATVTVKLTMSAETLSLHNQRAFPLYEAPSWYYQIGVGEGWLVSTFDAVKGEQIFLAQAGILRPERAFGFRGAGQARVDYFECGSATPTRSKVINWVSPNDAGVPPPPLDANLDAPGSPDQGKLD